MPAAKGLLDRLKDGDNIVLAEGYLFDFERRGYLKAGAFVPEVVLEQPHLVKSLYEEYVHAGSDVVLAFTYYGHREKLAIIDREDILEKLNRKALQMARQVADDTGTLMAGNICNTTCYDPNDPKAVERCRQIFKEQILWAKEEKADFIIGETYVIFGEAKLALECIKEYAPGMPAVIMMAPNESGQTYDGLRYDDCLRQLEELGAAVVGLNCFRGPDSMIPIIKEVKAKCKGPIGCLPVPYRTTDETKTMFALKDYKTGENSFPVDLDAWLCSRSHITQFTKQMQEIGVQFMGVCCGNRAHFIRAMAEGLGRKPPASKYSTDMTQHWSKIQRQQNSYNQQNWHQHLRK